MNYRERFYSKYATVVQPQVAAQDPHMVERAIDAYRTYLRGWLPADKSAAIVDVACGMGWLLKFFRDAGYSNVLGLDISHEQVALARRFHANVEQANALEYLPRNPERFDLMLAIDVIEHLTRDEILTFTEGAFRALRPGGRLIVQTPNGDNPYVGQIFFNDFTHEHCFTPRTLAQVMQISGFTHVEARELPPIARSAIGTIRSLLWKLQRAGLMFRNRVETGGPGSGVFTRVFIASGRKPG